MKHILMIDDEMLTNFRVEDSGTTLITYDKRGFERGFKLFPLAKPVVVNTEGMALYLTQGHIDTLLDYEKAKTFEKIMNSFHVDNFKWISGENEDV